MLCERGRCANLQGCQLRQQAGQLHAVQAGQLCGLQHLKGAAGRPRRQCLEHRCGEADVAVEQHGADLGVVVGGWELGLRISGCS